MNIMQNWTNFSFITKHNLGTIYVPKHILYDPQHTSEIKTHTTFRRLGAKGSYLTLVRVADRIL